MSARIAHVATVDLTPRFLLLAQLRALRDAGHEVSIVCAGGAWTADLEAEGFRWIPWRNATRAWDPASDARAFVELVRLFRRERFDLVHTHNPKPGVIGRIAARVAGIPCVVNTVHGLYATPDDRALRKLPVLAAEWIAARCSDAELYQSAEDLRWARRLGIVPRGRAIHLGNGVDLDRFDPAFRDEDRRRKLRRFLGIDEDAIVVGAVGRMVVEKGYRELFAAARAVRAAEPDVRFVAIGDRDLDKWDAIGAEEIEAARDDVLFVGWREDVPDLLGMMDLFVLPSWREGMPRSAIEAAASGLPLVLTDIRGCREVVRGGDGGLLVPVRDPDALADAILALVGDPARRVRMGQRARASAERRFDERRVARTVVAASEHLLGRAGRVAVPDRRILLRGGRSVDAGALAALHRASMPEAFLPTLGDGFLRVLYRALASDRRAALIVAERAGRVVGFAAAVPSRAAFFRRFVLWYGLPAAIAAARHVVRPAALARARETWAHPTNVRRLPQAELLSIAVADGERGQGVGAALVARVGRELRARGVGAYAAIAGVGNASADRFYGSLGFTLVGRFEVHRGTPSNAWVMSCR